jgi:molybdopterin/thiamine biosynthesis adenylyltransferase
MPQFASARVLVVGVGGLGCPAILALARAGIGVIGVIDDDEVDRSNLHRQILFEDADVGKPKTELVAPALERWRAAWGRSAKATETPATSVVVHRTRLLPPNAVELVRSYDLIVEGSDNFATKFLTADACALARRPVVHGAAVRWHGTALAVGAAGRPCYRCLFEDVPIENAPNCAEAGVVGPNVGVVAAAQADLALGLLDGTGSPGELFTFDAKSGAVRRRAAARRAACPLCGDGARIESIEARRYVEGLA